MNLVVFGMQKSNENSGRKFDLEDRLVNFAVNVLELVESLPETRASMHLGGQLLRSGTSPALITMGIYSVTYVTLCISGSKRNGGAIAC